MLKEIPRGRALLWAALALLAVLPLLDRLFASASSPARLAGVTVSGGTSLQLVDRLERRADQRRRALAMLDHFAGAQLVSQYWGTWVPSLAALGLQGNTDLSPRLRIDDAAAELWIAPREGRQRYLARVARLNDEIRVVLCRGSTEVDPETAPGGAKCPPGWTILRESR